MSEIKCLNCGYDGDSWVRQGSDVYCVICLELIPPQKEERAEKA